MAEDVPARCSASPRSPEGARSPPHRPRAASAPSPRVSPRVGPRLGACPGDARFSALYRGLRALFFESRHHPGLVRHLLQEMRVSVPGRWARAPRVGSAAEARARGRVHSTVLGARHSRCTCACSLSAAWCNVSLSINTVNWKKPAQPLNIMSGGADGQTVVVFVSFSAPR